MGEQLYKDSVYRFTDPVRYFKANDPYYFEVDNIPLKQLMENCNWLRDQLAKEVEQVLNIRRFDIQELKDKKKILNTHEEDLKKIHAELILQERNQEVYNKKLKLLSEVPCGSEFLH